MRKTLLKGKTDSHYKICKDHHLSLSICNLRGFHYNQEKYIVSYEIEIYVIGRDENMESKHTQIL